MLRRTFDVQVEPAVPGRRAAADLEEGAFHLDFAVRDFSYACKEVPTLDPGTHHLWIVVDLKLFGVDTALFILFVDELISNLDDVLNGSLVTHDFRLVLLNCEEHCLP